MKFKLDIDCTPEEAQKFLGLPEVQPLQEALLKEVQEQMSANIKAMDAKAMIETWLPATLKGFEQLQQMFMAQMACAPARRSSRIHPPAQAGDAAGMDEHALISFVARHHGLVDYWARQRERRPREAAFSLPASTHLRRRCTNP